MPMLKALYRKSDTEYNAVLSPEGDKITVLNISDKGVVEHVFSYVQGLDNEELGIITSPPLHIIVILKNLNIDILPETSILKDYRFITKGILPPIRPELKPAIVSALLALGHDCETVKAFVKEQL